MPRWVRKDRRIYDFSLCTYCGTAWGGFPNRQCPLTTCRACGTTQCLGNGLANGTCAVCYIGLLPGWSSSSGWLCGYKGCGRDAVARVGGQAKFACAEHLARNGKADYVARAVAERDRAWTEAA